MDDDIIKYIIPKLSGPQEPIDPEPTEGMTIPPLRVTVGPKAPDVRLASSVASSILFHAYGCTSGGCYRTSSYEYSLFKHSFKMKAILSDLSALLLIFGLVQESFANNPNWNKIFSLVNHVA